MEKYDALKLDDQLCFPLYAASREVIKSYRPFLDAVGLTYTQYITMMVIWEVRKINVKELGDRLFLDSGTLTPVLKSLEAKGYITRNRSKEDERILIVEITETGEKLKERAAEIPNKVSQRLKIALDDAKTLNSLLQKLLSAVRD
jgi:DNA-binding MarR family transcriptional regulator